MNERTIPVSETNNPMVQEDILAKFPRSADGVLLLPGTRFYYVRAEIKPSSLFKEHHVTAAAANAATVAFVTVNMQVHGLAADRNQNELSDPSRLFTSSFRVEDLSRVFFDRAKAITHMTSCFPHHNPPFKEVTTDAAPSDA